MAPNHRSIPSWLGLEPREHGMEHLDVHDLARCVDLPAPDGLATVDRMAEDA
jgi:hypothetical protein